MNDLNLTLLLLNRIKHHNSDNPVTSKSLEQIYKCNGSKIRDVIHNLRIHGEPIGSGDGGYFYCNHYYEIESTVNHLRSRAADMFETARAIEKKFDHSQMELI